MLVFLSGHVTFLSSCHDDTKYPLNGERSMNFLNHFQAFVLRIGADALVKKAATFFAAGRNIFILPRIVLD